MVQCLNIIVSTLKGYLNFERYHLVCNLMKLLKGVWCMSSRSHSMYANVQFISSDVRWNIFMTLNSLSIYMFIPVVLSVLHASNRFSIPFWNTYRQLKSERSWYRNILYITSLGKKVSEQRGTLLSNCRNFCRYLIFLFSFLFAEKLNSRMETTTIDFLSMRPLFLDASISEDPPMTLSQRLLPWLAKDFPS